MYKSLTIVIFILIAMTIMRNNIWQTDIKLWSDNVKKSQAKARPNLNLGIAYLNEDRWQESEPFFKRVLEINPEFHRAKYSLSEALFNMQRYEEALKYLKEVESAYLILVRTGLESKKRGAVLYHNIAACYYKLGNLKEAEIYYKKAIDMVPDSIQTMEGLVDLLIEQNRKEEAIFYMEELIALANSEYKNREKLKNILKELKKGD